MIKTIICKHCKKSFQGHHRRIFCSEECKKKYRHGQEFKKICAHCNSEFITKAKKTKYCSNDCKKAAKRAGKPEEEIVIDPKWLRRK
jgi:uncharacterized Zn ribbon protein